MNRSNVKLILSLFFIVCCGSAFAFQFTLRGDGDLTTQTRQNSHSQQVAARNSAETKTVELDFETHVEKLREKLPDEGYSIVVEKPFVVIGNQSPKEVQRWSEGTIRWSIKNLKESYFKKDPDHIINIWLFKDAVTYEAGATAISGRKPTTPYGYYSPSDKALVMNISTGGGTLVHEIVHPFMAVNFEQCPSWFNEGLASLYEQSAQRNRKIVGLTNWRLRGLQFAIKDGILGSFKKLTATTTRGFYEGDDANYAQARYLCYWMQEAGVLRKFYREFAANADEDPTGIETLKRVLEIEDIEVFQKKWEQWVSELTFP